MVECLAEALGQGLPRKLSREDIPALPPVRPHILSALPGAWADLGVAISSDRTPIQAPTHRQLSQPVASPATASTRRCARSRRAYRSTISPHPPAHSTAHRQAAHLVSGGADPLLPCAARALAPHEAYSPAGWVNPSADGRAVHGGAAYRYGFCGPAIRGRATCRVTRLGRAAGRRAAISSWQAARAGRAGPHRTARHCGARITDSCSSSSSAERGGARARTDSAGGRRVAIAHDHADITAERR